MQGAASPVIVLLHASDPEFISEESNRGVFAHISDADVDDWQSAIDIVLRRFAEYQDLQGAFGRRALTERAKAILMERHGIDERAPSKCSASTPGSITANSSTSPRQSSTDTDSGEESHSLRHSPNACIGDTGQSREP